MGRVMDRLRRGFTVPGEPATVDSYMDASVSVTGSFTSTRNLGIDGYVEGEVRSEGTVVVGREGKVKANINARVVIVAGTVVGNIDCETLEIESTGSVTGNVTWESLLVARGAVFQGQSFMRTAPTTAQISEPESMGIQRLPPGRDSMRVDVDLVGPPDPTVDVPPKGAERKGAG